MTVGNLIAKLVLDQPKQLHYGAETEVTGKVVVNYNSQAAKNDAPAELFGPMELYVFLEGRAKTKIRVKRGKYTTTHRGRVPLLSIRTVVHTGPFRIAKGQALGFPFRIRFPEHIQDLPTENFDMDPNFDMSPGALLPPSMTYVYDSGMMNHRFECFVQYRARPQLAMPGIDVAISLVGFEEGSQIVYYEQPRVHRAIMQDAKIRNVFERLTISNQYLLPEHDRPSGFKAKTKAFFKSDAYPTFVTDITVTGSANLLLEQAAEFEISMRPNVQQTTAPDPPEVVLKSFTMSVRSLTIVRAEIAFLSRVQSEDREKQMMLPGVVQDVRPFSKANDYTKTVKTKPLAGVSSTFSAKNITRLYTIDFEIVVWAAEKEKRFKIKDIPVRILPAAIEQTAIAVAGSSAQGSGEAAQQSTGEEPLPAYEPPPPHSDEKAPSFPDSSDATTQLA